MCARVLWFPVRDSLSRSLSDTHKYARTHALVSLATSPSNSQQAPRQTGQADCSRQQRGSQQRRAEGGICLHVGQRANTRRTTLPTLFFLGRGGVKSTVHLVHLVYNFTLTPPIIIHFPAPAKIVYPPKITHITRKKERILLLQQVFILPHAFISRPSLQSQAFTFKQLL